MQYCETILIGLILIQYINTNTLERDYWKKLKVEAQTLHLWATCNLGSTVEYPKEGSRAQFAVNLRLTQQYPAADSETAV